MKIFLDISFRMFISELLHVQSKLIFWIRRLEKIVLENRQSVSIWKVIFSCRLTWTTVFLTCLLKTTRFLNSNTDTDLGSDSPVTMHNAQRWYYTLCVFLQHPDATTRRITQHIIQDRSSSVTIFKWWSRRQSVSIRQPLDAMYKVTKFGPLT